MSSKRPTSPGRASSASMGASHNDSTGRPPGAPLQMLRCNTCGRKFYLDETDSPPFCSERCKLIDLGRWLEEEIGLPHEGGPEKGEVTEGEDSEENDPDPWS